MLQKPKFLIPSINMYGKSVIDLNDSEVPFSCIVDGNEAIVKWQIEIFTLSDNTKIFDSGEKSLATPFYPINNKNQNVVFYIDLKDECVIPNTFINNSEPYYWHITLWGISEAVATSCDEVFYANSKPETSVYYSYDNNTFSELTEGSLLENRKIYFRSTYLQDEDVSLKRYGWRITNILNGVVLLDTVTNNQIYGIENDISCYCEGLINDTEYEIELYIETQNGFSDIFNTLRFTVDYETQHIGGDINVEGDNYISGVTIDFSDIKTIEGIVEGEKIKYIDNYPVQNFDSVTGEPNGSVSIDIPENSRVLFRGNTGGGAMEISEDSYIVLSFQLKKKISQKIFTIKGLSDATGLPIERNISYNAYNNRLEYEKLDEGKVSGETIYLGNSENEKCWYVLILNLDGQLILGKSKLDDTTVLYPSDNLFPSNNTFPQHGEWGRVVFYDGSRDIYIEDPWGDLLEDDNE